MILYCVTILWYPSPQNVSYVFMIFILSIILDVECSVNYSCSATWPSRTYIHTFFFLTSSSIVFHQKWLDVIPCTVQQGLIADPLWMQESASLDPRLRVHPAASASLWHPQVCSSSACVSFLWEGSFVPCIRFQIEVTSYGIGLSLSDVLHPGWESLVPSLLLQVALFCSF